jgi:hypothetical protein
VKEGREKKRVRRQAAALHNTGSCLSRYAKQKHMEAPRRCSSHARIRSSAAGLLHRMRKLLNMPRSKVVEVREDAEKPQA